MPDQMQEWKQLAFGGPDPAVGHARVPAPGRQVAAENVRLLSDGSYRWCRDQFYIKPPAVTPLSLFEYKTSSLNRLLAFGNDGGLYRLTTNWPAAAKHQWDFGYELFPNTSWVSPNTSGNPAWATSDTTGLSTNTEGCFALAQYNDYLYLALDSAQMLRYDGTQLVPVGLLSPFSPPGGGGTAEDFTTTASPWTETDPSSYLTLTADTVTAVMPASSVFCEVSRVVDALGDFTFTFEAQVDSMTDGSEFYLMLVVIPSAPDASISVARSGSVYKLWLGTSAFATVTPGVPFYVRWVTQGSVTSMYVYGESDYSDNPQVVTVSGYYAAGGEEIDIMRPGTPTHDAFSGYLKNLVLEGAAQGSGDITAGTRRYVLTYVFADDNGAEIWESMPSDASPPFVSTGSGGFTLTNLALYSGNTYDYHAYRKLYRNLNGGEYDFLVRIDDNTTTTYNDTMPDTSLGETFPYDYAIPPWCKDMVLHNDRAFFFRVTQTSTSYTVGLYHDASAPYTTGLDNTVFYSELGKPWYCSIFNQFKVGDAAEALGGCSWHDQLFIFKTNGVHVYSGWTDETFDLQPLDDHGACAYRAWCAGSQGVMWASHDGLMFYDGAKVTMLASYTDGGLTRPRFDDGEYPKMCFSHGKYYFTSGDDLWWFDAQRAVFGCDTMGPIGNLGIQAFQLGDGQAHVLCGRTWDSSTSGGQEISVLHGGEDFTNFAGEGSSSTDYYAPIDIIFAPLVPEPDQLFTALEIWLDASWTSSGDSTRDPKVYWSNDDMATWTEAGAAPQGNGKLVLRDVQGAPIYLRIQATEAPDFCLYGAKVMVSRKQARGYA